MNRGSTSLHNFEANGQKPSIHSKEYEQDRNKTVTDIEYIFGFPVSFFFSPHPAPFFLANLRNGTVSPSRFDVTLMVNDLKLV